MCEPIERGGLPARRRAAQAGEAVGSEREDLTRPGSGLGRCRRHVVLLEWRGLELVEQLVDRALVVARAVEILDRVEQLEQRLAVVVGEVARAVVGEHDPPCELLVGIDVGDRELLPAELARRQERVVSGEHLHRPAVDDHALVDAVGLDALLEDVEVAAAWVAGVGPKLGDGDRRRLELVPRDPRRGGRTRGASLGRHGDLFRIARASLSGALR